MMSCDLTGSMYQHWETEVWNNVVWACSHLPAFVGVSLSGKRYGPFSEILLHSVGDFPSPSTVTMVTASVYCWTLSTSDLYSFRENLSSWGHPANRLLSWSVRSDAPMVSWSSLVKGMVGLGPFWNWMAYFLLPSLRNDHTFWVQNLCWVCGLQKSLAISKKQSMVTKISLPFLKKRLQPPQPVSE